MENKMERWLLKIFAAPFLSIMGTPVIYLYWIGSGFTLWVKKTHSYCGREGFEKSEGFVTMENYSIQV